MKFKLKGKVSNLWALKVVKELEVGGQMRKVKEKIHLKGDTEYNSEALTQSYNCEPISYEEIKKQFGDVIIWEEEKKEDKPEEKEEAKMID